MDSITLARLLALGYYITFLHIVDTTEQSTACLAGAVAGDHCSPISDTTIMASTGGQCDHINHVQTQLPYVLLVVGVSFVGYILTGFIQSAVIVLPICFAILIAALLVIRSMQKKNA